MTKDIVDLYMDFIRGRDMSMKDENRVLRYIRKKGLSNIGVDSVGEVIRDLEQQKEKRRQKTMIKMARKVRAAARKDQFCKMVGNAGGFKVKTSRTKDRKIHPSRITKAISVLSLGAFLKKKHGITHQYRYRQLPGSRTIVKELVA